MTVTEFIETRYWPKVRVNLSEQWQRRSEDLLGMIKGGLGAFEIDQVPVEEVEGFLNTLYAKYHTPVTPNKVVTRGKHLFKTAIRWKAATENPFEYFRKKREDAPVFTPLTLDQHDMLIEDAGEHLRPYLVYARYTGARRSSLAKLEERDIDVQNNTITFRETKNGDDYTIPMHPRIREDVTQRLTGNPTRRLLHQYNDIHTISQLFRRLKARNRVKGFRLHDYRHNVGTQLAERGHNVKVIMSALGHKDMRMSIRYTHIAKEVLEKALTESL